MRAGSTQLTMRDFLEGAHPPVFRWPGLCIVVDDAAYGGILNVTKAEPDSRRGPIPPGTAMWSGAAIDLGESLARQTPVLLAAARALLRNEADARDLVQTTLEIATRKVDDLRDPTALRSWLLAIQVREAFRFRRRLGRLVRLTPEITEISPLSGPDADVIALRAALPKLPTRARAAVVLHYLADLPVAEVAKAMSISENTTKGHLKAGLARLRQELEDDD
jgi:RNA polymerase sigma-70 factor (ECF subfamily)